MWYTAQKKLTTAYNGNVHTRSVHTCVVEHLNQYNWWAGNHALQPKTVQMQQQLLAAPAWYTYIKGLTLSQQETVKFY